MAALYRKYRQQDFDEVIGQEGIVRTLKNAVAGGHVRQAYLFAGPRGTGKTSMARILAKALNCAQGPTPTPDKVCNACVTIANGTSLDVIAEEGLVERTRARGEYMLDRLRELQSRYEQIGDVRGRAKPMVPAWLAAKLTLPGAHSSAGERPLHTREVPGSIPGAPTPGGA